MKVPLLDLTLQYRSMEKDLKIILQKLLEEQKGILGPEVEQLEKAVASFCQSPFAVGVASGSDALILSLMALEAGPKDGVITTPFTFFATVSAIVRVGATPFFCDIRSDTFNLDPVLVEKFLMEECTLKDGRAIHNKTKSHVRFLLPVHLYGQCADMKALGSIAKKWNLHIIEDACQSIGATYNGIQSGTMGEFGTLSFFPSKNLGGLGDGGMVLTSSDPMARRLKALRVHGSETKYFHKFVGLNSRLDTLQAGILLLKLTYLKKWMEARRANAKTYDQALAGVAEISTPKQDPQGQSVYNQYVIRASRRDELRAHLQAQGIGSEIYYPLPLHLQECFRFLGYSKGDFPQSEKASEEVLALPIYPELTIDQKRYVIETIQQFYAKKKIPLA